MIILPDRSISRSQFLMAVPKKEWMLPSAYTTRDQFGHLGIRTRFVITGRCNGHMVWQGLFEDRDDFDAFLFALADGSIKHDKTLWTLPTPEWNDGLLNNVVYEFATNTIISAAGAGNYTIPTDWNSGQNVIYGIGAGGHGAATITTTIYARSTGGGGGEYRALQNFSATPGASIGYVVGSAGVATSLSSATSSYSPGNSGTNTTFNSTSLIAVGGSGGMGFTTDAGTSASGDGGKFGTGDFGANGGDGRMISNYYGSAGGGGGAAGPNSTYSATSATGTAGSASETPAANNTSYDGGAGGSFGIAGGNAPAGTGQSATVGGGGGGAGMTASNGAATAGSGGNYGAGGGGVAIRSVGATRLATPGYGKNGILSVTYQVATIRFSNIPILGL